MSSKPTTTTPDLASILATLASLAPQGQESQHVAPGQHAHPQPTPLLQQAPQPYQQTVTDHAPALLQQWQQPIPVQIHVRSTPVEVPSVRVIDPATILDWSAGLKCVMRTVAKQENILNDIRRMIRSQQEHEQQWWDSRLDLVEKQRARVEGQKKLESVLLVELRPVKLTYC